MLSFVLRVLYDNMNNAMVHDRLVEAAVFNPLAETAAFGGFSFLVGFIIVFRTSQSYGRFQEAMSNTHAMVTEWFDAATTLVSFARSSKKSEDVPRFIHILVRLFSIMSAGALKELTDADGMIAEAFEMIDPMGLDEESYRILLKNPNTVVLTYQWIQQFVNESHKAGILDVPPPILGRAFTELGTGMSKFQDAMKTAKVPFPYPYAQTSVTLLVMHWFLTPLVMAQWTNHAWASAVFTFIQVFILWSLNVIATGLESPFGGQENDIDPYLMQERMNAQLMVLVSTKAAKTPSLSSSTATEHSSLLKIFADERRKRSALVRAWRNEKEKYSIWFLNQRFWASLRRCCPNRFRRTSQKQATGDLESCSGRVSVLSAFVSVLPVGSTSAVLAPGSAVTSDPCVSSVAPSTALRESPTDLVLSVEPADQAVMLPCVPHRNDEDSLLPSGDQRTPEREQESTNMPEADKPRTSSLASGTSPAVIAVDAVATLTSTGSASLPADSPSAGASKDGASEDPAIAAATSKSDVGLTSASSAEPHPAAAAIGEADATSVRSGTRPVSEDVGVTGEGELPHTASSSSALAPAVEETKEVDRPTLTETGTQDLENMILMECGAGFLPFRE
eukprot:TRINITY_DN21743_c0_g1_i1.p1 TRINITY_DN21743_c0_g1~~TRINITY_DN21743_c0_g1_i1.p1  ORF type:complete len:671 (+),score=84.55 TRINITY_DN21743_c0_g1_i1:158-2014(+)